MPLTDTSFLFDDNPNPMWIFEISSLRILKVNKAAIYRYGYTEDEFLSMTTTDLRPSLEVDVFDKYRIAEAKLNDIDYSGVWKHQNKVGEFIYAEINGHDLKYKEIDCRIVVATDATERLKYQEEAVMREQELVGTKSSLEALINNTDDQIWSVDRDGRYVYMNLAYRRSITQFTGMEPKEGDFSNKHTGFGEEVIKRWNHYYDRALGGEIYTIINESPDPMTEQVISFEISFNPIYRGDGLITGVGCFARNITERLKTERAIVDQNERLRNIASLTSHELRRPVASMIGLINIMDRENFFNPDNKEIIEHLLTVGKEIDEVIRLIVDNTITENTKNRYLLP
jgi:PAS domain S-box-containing protein